ncbi:MAG: class IV adenylate cyclase [bacterium]|nr:class IV adenylate cyclase [bacterium]
MKNIEIELKYKIDDIGQMTEQIEKLGAEFKQESTGVDTYYIVPDNPGGKKYLRVRKKDGNAELDYHYAQSETRTDEWETGVASADMTNEILRQLGFQIDVTIEKKRTVYTYKNSELVLDEIKDLGTFIEIESPNEEELQSIIKELNLKGNQRVKSMGYSDLKRGYMF